MGMWFVKLPHTCNVARGRAGRGRMNAQQSMGEATISAALEPILVIAYPSRWRKRKRGRSSEGCGCNGSYNCGFVFVGGTMWAQRVSRGSSLACVAFSLFAAGAVLCVRRALAYIASGASRRPRVSGACLSLARVRGSVWVCARSRVCSIKLSIKYASSQVACLFRLTGRFLV